MRKWAGFLTVAAILGLGAAASAQPVQSWELRDGGRWQQVTAPTTAPVADETLDRVQEMIANKQSRAAKKIAVAWIKSHQDSPIRDRAVYLLGQANFAYGDRLDAFYNFDEVLEKYPDSRYWYPSLEQQYEIADQYLKGYKRRFLGIPMLDASSEATEILYRLQQRAPGSPLAEKSLLRVADYYYASGDFDLAADAYGAYVKSYPRSPYIPRVRLRQAFSALAQFRGVRFDATPVIDARQQLLDLTEAYPRLAEEENIPAIVTRINLTLRKKLLVTADFYRRTDKPKASAYYLQYLIRNYSDSPEAAEARERLANLPAAAVAAAQPETNPASATTGPAGQTQPASPANRESR